LAAASRSSCWHLAAPLLNMMEASTQHLLQQTADQQIGVHHEPAGTHRYQRPAIPEIWLGASACLILLVDAYGGHRRRA